MLGVEESEEYSFYGTSAARGQYPAQPLLGKTREHWSASEHGSHYRRDSSSESHEHWII